MEQFALPTADDVKKVAKDFAEGKTSPKKALKKILDNSK